jgi:transcriptional regulator with XRE-family HTH domain
MARKAPTAVDRHVGMRVRMRRLMLGASQKRLSDALGVSFQQVQKYEKGTNRIGASRLKQVANFLHVHVAFFFEGSPQGPNRPPDFESVPPLPASTIEFLATNDGLALCQAFIAIEDGDIRRSVLALVEECARADL